MSITVTLPVAKPTNVQLTLVSGGNLPIGKTYYVKVAGFDSEYLSPYAHLSYRRNFHSPLSDASSPVSVTTDATYRSIQVTWTNSAGADRYNVFVSETDGDFAGLKSYQVINDERHPDIQSPVTITDLPDTTYINHSCLIKNNLVHYIDKNLGIIKVSFTGTESHDLDDVYDAIVAQGYSGYAYYDGFNFAIKGSFVFEGTDAGEFVVERKSLIFIKGCICKDNPNYVVRFGRYVSDSLGADYIYGCYIDIQNSRYPIHPGILDGENNLEMYGTLLQAAASVILLVPEPEYYIYYYGGGQQNLGWYIDNFKDTFLGMSQRSMQGIIRELKITASYMSGIAWIDCWSVRTGYLHSGPQEGFYRCKFGLYLSSHATFYHYLNNTISYERYWYDCEFLESQDDRLIPRWTPLYAEDGYTDESNARVRVTFKLKVTDKNGNNIEGANVIIKDQFGNDVTLYTKDYNNDDRLLGSVQSPVQTDSNGEIDYYLETYIVNHEDGNPSITAIVYTEYYPFHITITKGRYQAFDGYFDLIEKTEWDIALQPEVEYTEALINADVEGDEITGVSEAEEITGVSEAEVIEVDVEEDTIYADVEEDIITGTIL
jgi:hypothetical protein